MNLSDMLVTIGTSSIVTGIVTFVFKTSFEESLKNHFTLKIEEIKLQNQVKLEKLKNEIEISSDQTKRENEESDRVFAKAIELAYRIKNISKDMVVNWNRPEKLNQLFNMIESLKECLYANRFSLEKTHYFMEFHSFKNKSIYFGDLLHLRINENKEIGLTEAFNDLETGFNNLIERIIRKDMIV